VGGRLRWSEDIGVLAVLDGARLRVMVPVSLHREQPGRASSNRDAAMLMPPLGNLTLAVAVLSYAGQLNLTAIADRDTCPDLEVFVQGMRAALEDLQRSVCHTGAMRRNLLLR
jgi:WS/DGAT C-terminal domain